MTARLLSLATGNLPEFTPVEVVNAAAEASWAACGVWFDPATWTPQTTRETRRAFDVSGVAPFDIEVAWIKPGGHDPDHERLFAAGGEIGARHALVVSSDPDVQATKRKFERLCQLGERFDIDVSFEFLPITEVKSLPAALEIVVGVGHPRGRLLVDALHLARSGGDPDDLIGLPPNLFAYMQICDAPAQLPAMDYATVLEEAVDGRLMPGEGALPLRRLLAALPETLPIAPEMRAKWLREKYPAAADRAREILESTQKFLRTLGL